MMISRRSKEFLFLLSLLLSSTTFSGILCCSAELATSTSSSSSIGPPRPRSQPPPPPSFSNVVQEISRRGQATWGRSTTVMQQISQRGQATLAQSNPALHIIFNNNEGNNNNNNYNNLPSSRSSSTAVIEASSAVMKKRKIRKLTFPPISSSNELLTKHGGFYYGITPKTLSTASTPGERKPGLSESMSEALEELKYLRREMETMRKEIQTLRQKMIEGGDLEENPEELKAKQLAAQRKRQKECEKLATEIEEWAKQILQETEEDGWSEVTCNKSLRKTVNPTGRTTAYLKWMRDSRGDRAVKTDETEYPCIKCFSTIDAPLEDVCTYLSQESAAPDYNDVVVDYKDIEEISPNAKICWSLSPQILFLKSREFITFCHHRWKRDGTAVIVNQAWDHPDYPATDDENAKGKYCRAMALRGANFLSRDPEDPDKTRIIIVAHANPGGNVPQWAAKAAVNSLAPIEPFKLFHKINEAVQKNQVEIRQRLRQAEMVSTMPPGRSPRPAGIAQLGYACYWPNGGGVVSGDGGGGFKTRKTEEGDNGDSSSSKGQANSSNNDGTPQSGGTTETDVPDSSSSSISLSSDNLDDSS